MCLTPRETMPPDTKPFSAIPGPGVADIQAYNSRNHQYLLELHEQYGDIVALDMSSMARPSDSEPAKRVVFVRQPEMVRKVTGSRAFGKTWDAGEAKAAGQPGGESMEYVHNLVQPLLTKTVFNNQGKGGVHHGRLQLKPMFMAVRQLSDGFAEEIDRALDGWPVDGPVDVLSSCHDLIRKSLMFAIAGSAAQAADAATEATFHEVLDYFVGRYASSGHDAVATAEDEATMAKMMGAGLRIVESWRGHGKAGGRPEAEERTMLAVMSEAGNSDAEMAAMVINAIIAGAEAPASTLAQLLQELAFNAPIQAALAGELAEVAPGGAEVADVLEKLSFVNDCTMEALRLFAPATLVQRVATAPTTLGGYELPAGTVVGICVTAVHRDASVHHDPWTFDPQGRHGKLNLHLLKKDACFMTFSGGPRGCPGKHLGTQMLRLALAKIVQRSEFFSNQKRADDHLIASSNGASSTVPKFVEWQVGGIPLEIRPRPGFVRNAKPQPPQKGVCAGLRWPTAISGADRHTMTLYGAMAAVLSMACWNFV